MVKTALKYTYIVGKIPYHCKIRSIHAIKRMMTNIGVMVNKSVNEFYTQFLFKIIAPPQDIVFPLEIISTFFKNLSPNVRELLIQ